MHYIKNYADIQMGPIFKNADALLGSNRTETEKFIAIDQFIKTISKPLIFDNLSKWRRIYMGNMIFGFGGMKLALLHIFIAICSFLVLLKRNENTHKVLLLISLATIANIILVSIGMHAIIRFTFYNDWVLFLTIFVLLNSLNKKLYES
jgi:O-antigen ligase